jgi:hypothetical protein
VDGKERQETLTAVYARFEKAKKAMGDAAYYGVLGQAGWEHKNQIPYAELGHVYGELAKAWKLGFKATANTQLKTPPEKTDENGYLIPPNKDTGT